MNMKKTLLSFVFCTFAIVLFSSNLYSSTYTFSESYSNQTDFNNHGWTIGISNYSGDGYSYNFTTPGHGMAITNTYFGSNNPVTTDGNLKDWTNIYFNKSIPNVDGRFQVSFDIAWNGTGNANTYRILLFVHGIKNGSLYNTIGSGTFSDVYTDAKGEMFAFGADLGTNPISYPLYYSGKNSLPNYSGSANISVIRDENNIITATAQSGSVLAQFISPVANDTEVYNVQILLQAPKPGTGTFDTVYFDGFSFTGESSTYQPPDPDPDPESTVPEPISIVLSVVSMIGLRIRFRR